MNGRRSLSRCLAAALLLATAPPVLALCSGFTDVDASHPFCKHVDWLRNREVTLGCSSTTLYCSGDAVLRLSMAAFMNRLGNALSPRIVDMPGGSTGLGIAAPAIVCNTGDIVPTAYPRSAHVVGVVNIQATAAVAVAMHVVYSTNGGATWTSVNQAPPSLAGSAGWINGSVRKGAIPLEGATTYRLALRLNRLSGASTLGPWTCHLKAELASRTGMSAPY